MDMYQLLEAVKSNIDRLRLIYQYYPPETDIGSYSESDRLEIRALQRGLEIYEDALRQIITATRAHKAREEAWTDDLNAP
jgi:hypothetical protein